ncbi:MAG: hypothetical protein LBT18_01115 [Endomicrobium sp.]|jgi:hypothetical protein|nr:hypothetical protein [Endomicrobium sp.]
MKKLVFVIVFTLTFIANASCFREFVEKIDYFVEFKEKSPEMAAVLHVNFISIPPESKEAEEIVKQQLKIYGNMIVSHNKVFAIVKKKTKYKNIIGSAWYINDIDPANPIKIKFQKDLAAYVWLGKTRKIVTFPNYMYFLKKERDNEKLKSKIAKKQLQEQELKD